MVSLRHTSLSWHANWLSDCCRESSGTKLHVQEPFGAERALARSSIEKASSSAGRVGQGQRGREGVRVDLVDGEWSGSESGS